MTDLPNDPIALEAVTLLDHYSFDLGAHTQDELMRYWLSRYPVVWIRSAIIEALYQGRYKAVSVDHILGLWHRRRQPCPHFNHEFERIICGNRARPLMVVDSSSVTATPAQPTPVSSDAWADSPDSFPTAASKAASGSEEPSTAKAESFPEATDTNPPAPDWALPPVEHSGIQAFKPDVLVELHLPAEISRNRGDWGHHPIHQFTPTAEIPEFYIKFQSVAQRRQVAETDMVGDAIATAHPSE